MRKDAEKGCEESEMENTLFLTTLKDGEPVALAWVSMEGKVVGYPTMKELKLELEVTEMLDEDWDTVSIR